MKNDLGDFKFIKFYKHIDKILENNNMIGFLQNQKDLKSKSDPFLVEILEYLYQKLDTSLSSITVTPKSLAQSLPDSVFIDVATSNDRPAWIGRKLKAYLNRKIGTNPTFLVTKQSSGNNSTYRFELLDGGYGGIQQSENKIISKNKINNKSNGEKTSEPPF